MARKVRTTLDLSSNKVVNLSPGTNGTDAVNLNQLNNAVDGARTYIGPYDPTTNTPNLTANDGSIENGNLFVVSAAGTFLGQEVSPGDSISAIVDDPTNLADFQIVNKNIPDIVPASETEEGLIEIATQAEVDAGTDTTRAVTPATLQAKLAGIDTTVPSASETEEGIAEIATQAEVDAGTDNTRIVTPAKLAARLSTTTRKFAHQNVSISSTPQPLTHNLDTEDVIVNVYENATNSLIICDVEINTANQIILTGDATPVNCKVVVIG